MNRQSIVAWAAAGTAVLLLALTEADALLGRGPGLGVQAAGGILIVVTYAVVGAFIASRRPTIVAWLFIYLAVVFATQSAASQYALHGLLHAPGSLPLASFANWLSGWTLYLAFPCAFGFLILLYPTGRVPSTRWRAALWFGVAALAFKLFGGLVSPQPTDAAVGRPNPTAVFGSGGDLIDAASWLFAMLFLAVAGAGLVFRILKARGDEREQIKWLVPCAGLIAIGGLSDFAGYGLGSGFVVQAGITVFLIGALLIPFATAFAILKYRLYDIDLVLNRAFLYTSLAVFISAIYLGVVVGVGALLGTRARSNLLLPIVATALVAFGFAPARRYFETVANRLVYGHLASPYDVLADFTKRVSLSYRQDELLFEMARRLADGTGAGRAQVWVRSGDRLQLSASWPQEGQPAGSQVDIDGWESVSADEVVPILHESELLGVLAVDRRRGQAFRPAEEKLISDLAQQTALLLKNFGLNTELRRRLEQLRASRQRLVSAQDQERRRIERDLHDGAQQHLIALKLQVGMAERIADPGSHLRELLSKASSSADEALATLRDLARGIYPPLLAEQGLVAALSAHSRKASLPVEVDAEGVGRYPAAVEASVYFCCLEALQNTQKYSQAERAVIRLHETPSGLEFAVEDDGKGFDLRGGQGGSGLQNMSDRVDSIGGRFELRSEPGRGTRVSGWIPLDRGSRIETESQAAAAGLAAG